MNHQINVRSLTLLVIVLPEHPSKPPGHVRSPEIQPTSFWKLSWKYMKGKTINILIAFLLCLTLVQADVVDRISYAASIELELGPSGQVAKLRTAKAFDLR